MNFERFVIWHWKQSEIFTCSNVLAFVLKFYFVIEMKPTATFQLWNNETNNATLCSLVTVEVQLKWKTKIGGKKYFVFEHY